MVSWAMKPTQEHLGATLSSRASLRGEKLPEQDLSNVFHYKGTWLHKCMQMLARNAARIQSKAMQMLANL